jgi:3-hydroxyacyl-CoA dehydrogenase
LSAEPAASKVRRYAQESDQRAGVTDIVNEPATPAAAVAVVGAGTMGSGIALCAVSAALPTLLTDTHAHALKQALARITSSCERAVANGKITASERDQRLSLLSVSPDPAAIGQADVVIEAVFEDLKVKQDVFRSIARIAQPDAILASNTSTLDLDRIAAVVAQPERVIGLHFFSPAHVMRLLEVVRGERTSISTIARAMAFAQQLGKTAVLARVCDGFIGNRTFEEYLRQAYFFLDEGALPAQVDQALERWGMALGPFAVMDLAGNDIGWAIRRRRATEQPHRPYS